MPGKPIKLTVAARRLGCHVETLRIRVREGRLKATRGPHGAYYVSAGDLAALPRPGQKSPPRQPTREKLEASWDEFERYLERNRNALGRELKLFREVREDPSRNHRLYRLLSVNRLVKLGLSFEQIAARVGISARHARRLADTNPLDRLRRDLETIRSRRRALVEARHMVDQLRAQLEAQGFRYHRLPLKARGRRGFWRFRPINSGEPQPAYKVKGLTQDEAHALQRAGLNDEQIRAVSLVGMGTDEVHELIMRGIRASSTSKAGKG